MAQDEFSKHVLVRPPTFLEWHMAGESAVVVLARRQFHEVRVGVSGTSSLGAERHRQPTLEVVHRALVVRGGWGRVEQLDTTLTPQGHEEHQGQGEDHQRPAIDGNINIKELKIIMEMGEWTLFITLFYNTKKM